MLISLKNYWDTEAVKALLAECMRAGEERVEEEVQSYLQDDSMRLFGSFVNGELAGLAGLCSSGEDLVIRHFVVKAKWRHKRLGSGMIEEIARAWGKGALKAETDHEAVVFYKKAGFSVTSLGEKYPGVERFQCILPLSRSEEASL
ncbi:GNAT family N-acetyltransferase [Paenibacillus sp. PK3_47]|uniref:GNAT family N-acetyltransferase n=1 Tax=Paenibacillus sp. PK3_47 TaxID=2072642 RepID=UPI00201DE02C|nr:GNAT family N-acetyltransferase [Paenibacillus sp. PK3_47]